MVISVAIELVIGMGLAVGDASRDLGRGSRAGVDPHSVRDHHRGCRVGVAVRLHARDRVRRLVVRHRRGVVRGTGLVAVRHHRHRGVEDHAFHRAVAARRPRARTREPRRGRRRSTARRAGRSSARSRSPLDEGRDPRGGPVPSLDAFRVFDTIFIQTSGANSTESLSILGYNQLLNRLNLGIGSTISVLIFLCVVIIATIFVKGFGANLAQQRGEGRR